jgi:hypothetical protein
VYELARRCGRLPLALRVAAEKADMRRLAAIGDRTAEFDAVAKAFWLLGLSPVTDLDRFGLAALVGADIGAAAALARRSTVRTCCNATSLVGGRCTICCVSTPPGASNAN